LDCRVDLLNQLTEFLCVQSCISGFIEFAEEFREINFVVVDGVF
jgi:hypothetical protein